jgi:ABC-type multidrug transport system ATPase subunit
LRTLSVHGLAYAFGRHHLFSDVTFSVEQGEALLVRGPNGSGKSTLLRLLAGLLYPPKGRVEYRDGEALLDEAGLRRELGMCAVEQNLYDELSALENLSFFGRLRLGTDCADLARPLLERAALWDHRNKPAKSLSSGMRQKLKLLAGVIHEPGFLLLDEPGSNLDGAGMEFLEGLIKEQKARGPVVLASNDPREFGYADRTYTVVL